MKLKVMERNGEMVLAVAGERQTLFIREEGGGFAFELLAEGQAVAVPVFSMEVAREESAAVDVPPSSVAVVVENAQEEVAAVETPSPSVTVEAISAQDSELFKNLAALRKELAAADGVPPYLIFHNKTLLEMVEKMPGDIHAMGAVSGVGQAKLEKYGAQFLAVINGAAA